MVVGEYQNTCDEEEGGRGGGGSFHVLLPVSFLLLSAVKTALLVLSEAFFAALILVSGLRLTSTFLYSERLCCIFVLFGIC